MNDPATIALQNDPLAKRFALTRRQRGADLDDLIQTARVGLLEAARRWNPARGSISTIAYTYMQREFNEFPAVQPVVRMPKETYHDARKLAKLNGVAPAGWDRNRARRAAQAAELLAAKGRGAEPLKSLGAPDGPYDAEAAAECDRLLGRLDDRSAEVLRWHYGLDGRAETFEVIARRLGLPKAHVVQIHDEAVRTLRATATQEIAA